MAIKTSKLIRYEAEARTEWRPVIARVLTEAGVMHSAARRRAAPVCAHPRAPARRITHALITRARS